MKAAKRAPAPARRYALLAGGVVVFVGSVVVAYVATRSSDAPRPAKQAPAVPPDPWVDRPDAAATANTEPPPIDPWTDQSLSPIVPEGERYVKLTFAGVPDDAIVTVNLDEVDPKAVAIKKSDKAVTVAVRQRDTMILFAVESVVPDRAQVVDFTLARITDCDLLLTKKSQRYCVTVYCRSHPSAPECGT